MQQVESQLTLKAFQQLSSVVPDPDPIMLPAPALLVAPPVRVEIEHAESEPVIASNEPEPQAAIIEPSPTGGQYGEHLREVQRRRDAAEAARDAADFAYTRRRP